MSAFDDLKLYDNIKNMSAREAYAHYLKQVPTSELSDSDKSIYKQYPPGSNVSSWYKAVKLISRKSLPEDDKRWMNRTGQLRADYLRGGVYYTACLLQGLQYVFNEQVRSEYSLQSSVQVAQGFINEVLGSDKILLQEALNNAQAKCNADLAILNKPFVNTYLKEYYSPFSGVSNRIKKYKDNINLVISVGKNAQYVAQQQALAREAMRREAEGLVELVNNLISNITSSVKVDFLNTLNGLVQMDYEPQIVGLKALVITVENQLKAEFEQREIEKVQQFVLQSSDIKAAIQQVFNQMPGALRDVLGVELSSIDKLFSDGQLSENQYLVELEALRNKTIITFSRYRFDTLLNDMNKLVSTLPADYAQSLFDKIKQIAGSTVDTYASLTNGINLLNNIAPEVDLQLTKLAADKIEQTIVSTEQERKEEIENIIASDREKTASELQALKLTATSLLDVVPADLYGYFQSKLNNFPSDPYQQASYFKAVIKAMDESIAIRESVESMTAEDITGLKYELDTRLQSDAEMIQQASDIQEANSGPGNVLPILGTLLFLFNAL